MGINFIIRERQIEGRCVGCNFTLVVEIDDTREEPHFSCSKCGMRYRVTSLDPLWIVRDLSDRDLSDRDLSDRDLSEEKENAKL